MAAKTPAKACKKALTDATARWPKRNRLSDGIMGDPAHQARKSDHNDGNAFDLTHDPKNGPDCNFWSRALVDSGDPRVTYVIWNRQIFKMSVGKWQKYTGKNPHDKHMHVSIKPSARNSEGAWPWTKVQTQSEIERVHTVEVSAKPGLVISSDGQPSEDSEDIDKIEKGVTTSEKPAEETAGTPPPAPAVEVKASQPSLFTKLGSLSIPAGVMTVLGGIGTFVQTLPPYVWLTVAVLAIAAAYLIYRESQKRAHERTLKVMDAAAAPDKNNIRLV